MIDLDDAPSLCPGIPAGSANPLCFRAVVALQRRHSPGVLLRTTVNDDALEERLQWVPQPTKIADTEDFNRATEEGAEALALALAARHRAWRAVRRLQARMAEGADWLMRNEAGGAVVLEVGGTDKGDLASLLTKKLKQARESFLARKGASAACVVRFVEPTANLQDNDGPR